MIQERKSVQKAWAFYDWANSAYSLVISTAIFPIYYDSVTSGESGMLQIGGWSVENTALYSFTIAFSFLVMSMLSPYLSALADVSGRKKVFMRFFVVLGSIACMSLYFFEEGNLAVGLVGAFFGSLGFSGSLVFYNAYLPEIARPDEQDRLSAKGFSLGYLGSSMLLIALLVVIEMYDAIGLSDKGTASRIAFLVVGLWWLGWSVYPLRKLPSNPYSRKVDKDWIIRAYTALIEVFKIFRASPRLGRFVMAFFFFSCGVQTTILLATLFGQKVLNIDSTVLIGTVLIIQFVGIIGAWTFARLSGRMGNIRSVGTAVGIWILICIGAYFITETWQFMVVGGFVGLVMGGVQSLARSTYSKLLPETKDHATFFSFYDVAEKLATTLGMFSVGILEYLTGDLRNSALALTAFFVVSLLFLFSIPKSKYVY